MDKKNSEKSGSFANIKIFYILFLGSCFLFALIFTELAAVVIRYFVFLVVTLVVIETMLFQQPVHGKRHTVVKLQRFLVQALFQKTKTLRDVNIRGFGNFAILHFPELVQKFLSVLWLRVKRFFQKLLSFLPFLKSLSFDPFVCGNFERVLSSSADISCPSQSLDMNRGRPSLSPSQRRIDRLEKKGKSLMLLVSQVDLGTCKPESFVTSINNRKIFKFKIPENLQKVVNGKLLQHFERKKQNVEKSRDTQEIF
ncbi:hypothetical protein [Brazilian marseillevirus]|uniref:hypothetical protein n=1 Tax=Brazilian marseillevirus TaxID=1813599 RepID=UPI0007814A6A|nr:hypothetical protein A3303_gp351 [Brazilian marseillevirus]AMQ10859.1 hypothetical protein [Brazilian marseillevirus]